MEVSIEVEKKDKNKEPDEWQIREWCRTIEEADEIKSDAKKMKYVKKAMEQKVKTYKKVLSSTDDLRKVADAKMKKSEYMDG